MLERPFQQPRLFSSQDHFSRVPVVDIPRSVFNRDHQLKTTLNAGYLVPIFLDEVLPGDSCKLSLTTFARLQSQVVPVMDNIYCDVHFFFVPNRLVWTHWVNFMGEEAEPREITPPPTYLVPTVDWADLGASGIEIGSMADYLGLPLGLTLENSGEDISALPFRAVNLIYDEWYRDQNFGPTRSSYNGFGDGPDDPLTGGYGTAADLPKRWKRHDAFTSALPWPQKGDAVTLPLGSVAPVISDGTQPKVSAVGGGWTNVGLQTATNNIALNTAQANSNIIWGNNTGLEVDLSAATAATLNTFRLAVATQQFLERMARGGTRYVEQIKSMFGVTNPDFRLQRPEYIGGGSTVINQAAIPQTSATGATGTPQGNLAATSTFSHRGVGFSHSFTEHGYVIGFLSIRADMTYYDRIERHWSRQTKYDYYWPTFAHLGEQSILRKEVLATNSSVTNNQVFGYQEAWYDYRYKSSMLTGLMRPSAAGSLDVWHLAQDWGGSSPPLAYSFLIENPPIDRVIAVTGEPQFLLDCAFDYKCARPMPVYSVPGLGRL